MKSGEGNWVIITFVTSYITTRPQFLKPVVISYAGMVVVAWIVILRQLIILKYAVTRINVIKHYEYYQLLASVQHNNGFI